MYLRYFPLSPGQSVPQFTDNLLLNGDFGSFISVFILSEDCMCQIYQSSFLISYLKENFPVPGWHQCRSVLHNSAHLSWGNFTFPWLLHEAIHPSASEPHHLHLSRSQHTDYISNSEIFQKLQTALQAWCVPLEKQSHVHLIKLWIMTGGETTELTLGIFINVCFDQTLKGQPQF